jgi:hypothetical protein
VFVCGAFFRAKDENGDRLPQDIRFEKLFNENIGLVFHQDLEELFNRVLIFLKKQKIEKEN